jgi:CheY-like chemotaxis protein
MSKPRVLFVDDEPRVLDGLRRSLRGKRAEWDMEFVTSGQDAIEVLAEKPHDVVVSDMRMPGMDGAELLTHVSKQHPHVARVVLSGHTEPEAAIRVAVAGHRFLNKPSEADAMITVIDELTATTSGTHAVEVRRIAGGVRCLPTLPEHVGRIADIFAVPDVDVHSAVEVTHHDVGLTAKLLQLSNSGFFGARARVPSADSVVSALGLSTIQALVGAGQVLWSSVEWGPEVDRDLGVHWHHAVTTACLVGSIATPALRPYAQAAAMLQDVGRFAALASAGHDDGAPGEATSPAFGEIPFRDVGVELLHLWGLPRQIIAAVAERDIPHEPSSTGLGVTGAVRVAHLLVRAGDARDLSAGEDDELTQLLAHPQLTILQADWARAAEDASAHAADWSRQ